MFLNEFKFLLPEIYLFFVIVFLFVSCMLFDNYALFRSHKLDFVKIHINLAILALVFLLFIIANLFGTEYLIFNGLLYGNLFTLVTKFSLTLVIISILASTAAYYRANFNGYEFILLFLVNLLAMFFMVSSSDFLSLFFSIELLSLSVYILTAYKRDSLLSTEAGLRYFILSAFISSLLAFGISLVYFVYGSTNFVTIKLISASCGFELVEQNTVLFYGFIFILSAFLFKLSSFPFHFWTPDVYEGAPLPVTKFLATGPKLVIVSVLIKLLGDVFSLFQHYTFGLLLFSGIATIVIGTLGGLFQVKVKRLLAYSTIANMGYILIALALGTSAGYAAALLYTYVYVMLSLGLFSALLSVVSSTGHTIHDLSELRLLHMKKFVSITFLFCLFSLAGIPPLAGFFSKFYLLYPLVSDGFYYLVMLIVLLSIVSAGYYMRLVNVVFFGTLDDCFVFLRKVSRISMYAISAVFLINLSFVFLIRPVWFFMELLVQSIFF
jgi:NADH-quinone oxidoreductase subunit N